MPDHPNSIISRLPAQEFEQLHSHLVKADMELGQIIAEPRRSIAKAWFPHSGVLSFVVDLPGGGGVETGLVGRDGAFGCLQALDRSLSLNRVVVQIPGEASVIAINVLRDLVLQLPRLRSLLIGYEQFFLAQSQQTAACNAHHTVEQKLCKWLCRMHDLTGDELPLTQEFIAHMIGVRRTSVSDAARAIQKLGMIDYSRGVITVRNKTLMDRYACECVEDIRDLYRCIFDPARSETS